MRMFLLDLNRSLFGFTWIKEKDPYKDILHLWEDDYLMIEIIPKDNLDFVKEETKRIQSFGEKHYNGQGFDAITPVSTKPISTIQQLIYFSEIEAIIVKQGMKKISKYYMQGTGLTIPNKNMALYGTNKYAIICLINGTLLEHLSIEGHIDDDKEKEAFVNILTELGQFHNLMIVNWFNSQYSILENKNEIRAFVKTSI